MSTQAPVLTPPLAGEPTTRERILDAAEHCMERHGIRRVSMADVAARAGLSRGALYLHFADRAALVDAVLARTAWRFVASSEVAVRRRRTLATQVAEAAVFIRQHLGDSMLTLRLPGDEDSLLATILTAQIERLVDEWVDFWLPLLADAERRGEIRADLDHRRAGEWIARVLLSFALLPPITFDADDPAELRAFVSAHVVAGLAHEPTKQALKGRPS
jgi:AcrR family transcriptional regulator